MGLDEILGSIMRASYTSQVKFETSCNPRLISLILTNPAYAQFFYLPSTPSMLISLLIQWYLSIQTLFDSNTSQSEHIWRTNFDLQSERGLTIRTQKHVAADAPSHQSTVLLAHLNREPLSLMRLGNGFQVTPAPSCLGYSSPQPWSLPTYHCSQCGLLLWSLANLFTNEDIFNTLNNQ